MLENIKTQEQNIELLLSEILTKAGERDLQESKKLVEQEFLLLKKEKDQHQGKISKVETIEQVKCEQGEKISEGAIVYTKISNNAKLITTSDIHGCRQDLDLAVKDFVQKKKSSLEDVYFNFNGDIGTGEPQKIAINEVFAGLKNLFPKEVNLNSGNGDRRSASLFNGLQIEMVEKFAPGLFKLLDERTKKILSRFYQEKEITDMDEKLKKQGFDYYSVFAAQFLRAARETGAEPLEVKDIDLLYQVMKAASGIDIREGKVSNVFTFSVLRHLREALDPESKGKYRKDKLIKDSESGEQALDVFNYWREQNKVYNEQPVFTIYENDNAIVICSHSGYVKEMDKLGDLVDNIEFQTKATWNQFMKDEVTAFGDYDIYNKEDLGKFLGKIISSKKNVILITGHNHGNKVEDISVLDKDGQDKGNKAIRVEVCSGQIKNKDPKYVVLDLAKVTQGGELESAVEFKDTK